MIEVRYKRTHIPSGKIEVCDFHDHTLIPWHGVQSERGQKMWVGDCEKLVDMWNKMGVVNGEQMWLYEVTTEIV